MKKKVFILLVFIYLFSIINVYATSAHNIYSDPQIDTNTIYDTFTIDFQGTQTPNYTYWALSNWGMDLNSFKQNHSNVEGGGAYAGLQTNEEGRRSAIMSFWEVSYDNGQKIRGAWSIYLYLNKNLFNLGDDNAAADKSAYFQNDNGIKNFNQLIKDNKLDKDDKSLKTLSNGIVDALCFQYNFITNEKDSKNSLKKAPFCLHT